MVRVPNEIEVKPGEVEVTGIRVATTVGEDTGIRKGNEPGSSDGGVQHTPRKDRGLEGNGLEIEPPLGADAVQGAGHTIDGERATSGIALTSLIPHRRGGGIVAI